MAERPPVFRPPGWKPRAAWEPSSRPKHERLRGRAGVARRAAVLAEEPVCRACAAKGKRVRAEVVDHIVPLAWGGSDERANLQALCSPCHDAKSALERLEGRRERGG